MKQENHVEIAQNQSLLRERSPTTESESTESESITAWAMMLNVFKRHRALANHHPQFIILAIIIFVVLLASGAAISSVFASVELEQMEADALATAVETGRFFKQNLDQAILPLFSLAQFVREIDEFQWLAALIGPAHAEGSLPFLPPQEGLDGPTHRNVSGVCDDPVVLKKYERIAGAVKKDSGMDGILVNLQLVPDGVVCLVHPVNNTEDFPPGVFLDSTASIGHDLLTDPERKFIAEATVASENAVIAGPVQLLQCPRQDCDPLVAKAFIVRLPLVSETNMITVNGISHKRWGFAVALINWSVLVDKSGVYDEFEKSNFEFQLTRTDYIPNPDDGQMQKNVCS